MGAEGLDLCSPGFHGKDEPIEGNQSMARKLTSLAGNFASLYDTQTNLIPQFQGKFLY